MKDFLNYRLDDGRLVLAVHAKAASTSIRRAILLATDKVSETETITREHFQTLLDSVCPAEVSILKDSGARVLTFVRHPATRLESCYRHFFQSGRPQKKDQSLRFNLGLRPDASFERFVRAVYLSEDTEASTDKHIRSMTYSCPVYDQAFRMEDGFVWGRVQAICRKHSLDLPDLEHANPSAERPSLLTRPLLEMIYERYKADYEAFGYQMEP